MFFLAAAIVNNPNRGESRMAECAIAHLRAFQQEFTINDLVHCTEKLSHITEAVETGGLTFKGKPTQVYQDCFEEAEEKCGNLVSQRKLKEKVYSVDKAGRVKVDYGSRHVAQQLWKYVSLRLKAVFKDGGVAECVHKALTEDFAQEFKGVPHESLQTFTAFVASALKVDPAAYQETNEEDIDADSVEEASAPPNSPQALAVNLTQLAQQVPLTDAEHVLNEPPSFDFFAKLTLEPFPMLDIQRCNVSMFHCRRAGVVQLFGPVRGRHGHDHRH